MRRYVLAGVALAALVSAGSALASPAGVVLRVGESHTFTRATFPAGATVNCVHGGHILALSNPRNALPWLRQGTVWTKPGSEAFHLYLEVKPAGGYVASCGIGASHW